MADHFIAINRGQSGMRESDFVKATSSTTAADIELRLADAAGLTRKDVIIGLDALKRAIKNGKPYTDFPVL